MSSPGDPSGDAVTSGVGDAVTLGVEEEFQLLDVETGHVVSRAPAVLAALPAATPPEWVQGATLDPLAALPPAARRDAPSRR